MAISLHETCKQYVARRLSEGWSIVSQKGYHLILSSPDGNILRPVDLRNDVETLRPNARGDECSISGQYGCDACPDHHTCVDEEFADGSSSRVQTTSSTYERDLYNIENHSVGSGTINFIKIYFNCKSTGLGKGHAKPSLKSNSTVTDGNEIVLDITFIEYSQQWNTNPAPPGTDAWTWDDIDALQIGVLLKTIDYAYCTHMYVEVDYGVAIVAPAVTTQAVTDIGFD